MECIGYGCISSPLTSSKPLNFDCCFLLTPLRDSDRLLSFGSWCQCNKVQLGAPDFQFLSIEISRELRPNPPPRLGSIVVLAQVSVCDLHSYRGYQPGHRVRARTDGSGCGSRRWGRTRAAFLRSWGFPVDETVVFARSWSLELDQAERSIVIRYAWQQYSIVLKSGNAQMILSANG